MYCISVYTVLNYIVIPRIGSNRKWNIISYHKNDELKTNESLERRGRQPVELRPMMWSKLESDALHFPSVSKVLQLTIVALIALK